MTLVRSSSKNLHDLVDGSSDKMTIDEGFRPQTASQKTRFFQLESISQTDFGKKETEIQYIGNPLLSVLNCDRDNFLKHCRRGGSFSALRKIRCARYPAPICAQ